MKILSKMLFSAWLKVRIFAYFIQVGQKFAPETLKKIPNLSKTFKGASQV